MNIFEFAMQMETDGENFYRDLATNTDNPGLSHILIMLAEDEVRHFEALRQIQSTTTTLPDTPVLAEAKTVFAQMKDQGDTLNLQTGQNDLYNSALELEKKSRDFYLEKADQVALPAQRELFQKLAAEEQKHVLLIENIIQLISRPDTWLEDAEWTHLDEY